MWGTLVPAVQLWTGDLTCPASAALPVQWANNHRPPSRWCGESDRERLGTARSAGKVYGDGLEVLHTLLLRASPDLRSRDVASFRCIVSPRRPLELARPRFASCMVTLRQCHASSCLSPLRSGANNADLTGSWGEGACYSGLPASLPFPISSSFLLGHLPYFWKKDEVCGRVLQDVFLDWWVLICRLSPLPVSGSLADQLPCPSPCPAHAPFLPPLRSLPPSALPPV